MTPTVLLVGLGDLGGVILELLLRQPGAPRAVVTGRQRERTDARAGLARLGAAAQGFDPRVETEVLDVTDAAAVAALVERVAPDVVLLTASRDTWWRPSGLPPAAAAPLARAGFGAWLPVHLALPLAFMRALRSSSWRGVVLTAPYPDVVNAVLGRLDLAPDCGVGNLDEIVPKVRLITAARLGVALDRVEVALVAHHALERFVFAAGPPAPRPPHFLRVTCDGDDVTTALDADTLLFSPWTLPWGPTTHFLTAGSAVRLIGALLSDAPIDLHAPGPAGLPGGYPVSASRAGVHLRTVPGVTLAGMIAINEQSHAFDGIATIEADGTVVFTAETTAIMQETLGYDCPRLAPADAAARADELLARFQEYAAAAG